MSMIRFLSSRRVTLVALAVIGVSMMAMQRTDAALIDVYLLAGQSNADGRGLNADLTGPLASYASPQSDVEIYFANNASPGYDTGWTTLAPGLSVPPDLAGGPLPSTTFGPELSFGRTVADAQPSRNVAIIKVTRGGSNLHTRWNPNGGDLYAFMIQKVNAALAALTNRGDTYDIRGMLWHQGESDKLEPYVSKYTSNLTRLINAVRSDLAVPEMPFIIGEVLHIPEHDDIRNAQFLTAQTVPFTSFVSAEGLTSYIGDDVHLDAASQIELGNRFAGKMLTYNLPEPSSLALLAGGVLAMFRRKR